MKLVVSRRAEVNIRRISSYVQKRHPSAALQIETALRASFTLLAAHPFAGRQMRPGIRRFSLTRYPYLVYYAVDEAASIVNIIAVVHAARSDQP